MLRRLMRPLDARFDRMHREIGNAQEMAARAYEAALRWPEQLTEIRADPDYELAYTEAEPLVSIRIATYNRAELLCERALASVRAQGYENWEVVVVGDCCTDDTAQRVASLGDERITFINLAQRQDYPDDPKDRWRVGGVDAVNAALKVVRGRWICPLDDDDELHPDHIETLLAVAQRERAEVAYGRLQVVDYDTGAPKSMDISRWPLQQGGFNWLAAIKHGGLKRFGYDAACMYVGEVADWNLARRLSEAGVRFAFTDQTVGTYWYRH